MSRVFALFFQFLFPVYTGRAAGLIPFFSVFFSVFMCRCHGGLTLIPVPRVFVKIGFLRSGVCGRSCQKGGLDP